MVYLAVVDLLFVVVVYAAVAVFVVVAAGVAAAVCDGVAALSMSAIPSWDFECHRRPFDGYARRRSQTAVDTNSSQRLPDPPGK